MIAAKLDGRTESRRLLRLLAAKVRRSRQQHMTLATILVGRRYDSAMYVKLKRKAAAEVKIRTRPIQLPASVSSAKLRRVIQQLNRDRQVHGILLQLPLPKHLHTSTMVQYIHPDKDVDGFHPSNRRVVPPPVAAVEHFLTMAKRKNYTQVTILGKKSVFTEQLRDRFQPHGWYVHIVQSNWAAYTRKSDIIITALGRGPRLLASQVKRGAVVIDVGIRKLDGRTVGDVDPGVWTKASAITPVPGGVGPLTVYYVLANTYQLAHQLL